MIKNALFFIIFLLVGIYSIPDAIYCFILKRIDKNKLIKHNNNVVKVIMKIAILVSGVRLHISGLENIDSKKAMLIISNHRSNFDIITGYNLIGTPCSVVAKNNLEKIPLLSYWMKKIGCIFLDRNDLRSGATMIVEAIKSINSGISIWICPEGTRNKNDNPMELLEFKAGAFKIAEKTDCNILPIAFVGSENAFEKNHNRVKACDIYINIGKPYKISELIDDNKKQIGIYSKNIIETLIKEIIEKQSV